MMNTMFGLAGSAAGTAVASGSKPTKERKRVIMRHPEEKIFTAEDTEHAENKNNSLLLSVPSVFSVVKMSFNQAVFVNLRTRP